MKTNTENIFNVMTEQANAMIELAKAIKGVHGNIGELLVIIEDLNKRINNIEKVLLAKMLDVPK